MHIQGVLVKEWFCPLLSLSLDSSVFSKMVWQLPSMYESSPGWWLASALSFYVPEGNSVFWGCPLCE